LDAVSVNEETGLFRQEKKRLRSREQSCSSESTTFVVADRVSSRRDNDDTATTTDFNGVSAALRTETELTSDRQQHVSEATNYPTAASDDIPENCTSPTSDHKDNDRASEAVA